MSISNLQRRRVIDYARAGKRFDGRDLTEYREMKVELGISQNAESSCSVKFGKTEVYAGVKMALVEPYADNPDEGTFMVTLELGPMADNDFDSGAPGINAIEMGRVIDRGIRESGFIDFKKMCVKEGEKVWQVFLDLYAVNNDGNLFDVAGVAALAALANARLPKINEETGKIEHEFTETPLPLNKDKMSINFTFHEIGDKILVDPSKEEEETADFRLSIAIADNKGEARITAMQKGKEGGMTAADMESILNLVEEQYKVMFPKISKLIWGKK